jgi:hypothetical protein
MNLENMHDLEDQKDEKEHAREGTSMHMGAEQLKHTSSAGPLG